MKLPTLFGCALLGATVGCGCMGVGLTETRPGSEVTLAPGQTFTAEFREGGECVGGRDRQLVRRELRWWTRDTLVLRVDSLSGEVRALVKGDGRVVGTSPGSPRDTLSVSTAILVHVR